MSDNRALKIVQQQHTELTKIGKKSVSVFGYRNNLVEEHLRWHLTQMSNKWCSVDCMARTMFGRASEQNREGIRKRMRGTFRFLLMRSQLFLVIEYDDTRKGHGKIKAVKLFEGGAGTEQQYAVEQIERMVQRQKMTEDMRIRAEIAIGCKRDFKLE